MPEQQQVTNDPAAWEAKYKELQADYTRKAQQLAEIEKMRAEGQLLEKSSYDDWLVKWASENPDQALEVFPNLKQHVLASGDMGGSNGTPTSSSPMGAFDDAIFDTNSEAHQRFRQEAADRAYRQALWAKTAPEMIEATGLGKELERLREFEKNYGSQLEALREEVEQSKRYAISSFDQVQLAQDPRKKWVRDWQEKLKETKGEAWYELHDKLRRLEELESKAAAPPPPAPAAPVPQTPSPTPEQLAARIEQASVVPQGAGSGSGQLPSHAIDPFDAAVAQADPMLAQRLGIPSAA